MMITPMEMEAQKILQYKLQPVVPCNKYKILDTTFSSDNLNYNFPSYYFFPYNLFYYFLLSPFKIVHSNSKILNLSGHPVQKVVCALFHIFLWILSVPSVFGSFKNESVHKNPAAIYKIFTSSIWTSNICILSYQCWCQQGPIEDVLRIRRNHQSRLKINCFAGFVVFVFILHAIPMYFYVPWDFVSRHWYQNIETNLLYMIQATTDGLSLKVSSITDGSPFHIATVLCCILYTFARDAIGFILFLQLAISCFAVYEIGSTLESQRVLCTDSQSIKAQINYYVHATSTIHRINRISGPQLAVNFMSAISFTSMQFVKILEGDNWPSTVTIAIFLTITIVIFVTAAEANAKIKLFEAHLRQYRIFDDAYNSSSPNSDSNKFSAPNFGGYWHPVSIYIDSIPGSTGLAAGSFFTLTYSLLGQASTVLLTYVIITVQLETGK